MEVSKKLINKFKKLKVRGDVNALAQITGVDKFTISRVIAGKQVTSLSLLEQINNFYNNRKKQLKKLR